MCPKINLPRHAINSRYLPALQANRTYASISILAQRILRWWLRRWQIDERREAGLILPPLQKLQEERGQLQRAEHDATENGGTVVTATEQIGPRPGDRGVRRQIMQLLSDRTVRWRMRRRLVRHVRDELEQLHTVVGHPGICDQLKSQLLDAHFHAPLLPRTRALQFVFGLLSERLEPGGHIRQ